MALRFTSGVYDPELLKMMSDALDVAWSTHQEIPQNVDLARQIMAAGVIEAVSSDERSAEELVAAAVRALDEAMKSSFLKTALHAAIRFRRV